MLRAYTKLSVSVASVAIWKHSILGDSYCLTDEEFDVVDKNALNNKLNDFATNAKLYLNNPESNKLLGRCFSNRNTTDIQLYYPNNISNKFNDRSKCGYARVATTVINAPIASIASLWFDAVPESRSEWNSSVCLKSDNVPVLNPLEITEDLKQLTALRKKKSLNNSHNISASNIRLASYVLNVSGSVFLSPRHQLSWQYSSPAGIIGQYNHFNNICLFQLDFDSARALRDTAWITRAVADHRRHVPATINSCLLLEYLAHDKTRVTYMLEADFNIHLLYSNRSAAGSEPSWWDYLTTVLHSYTLLAGADECMMLEPLRALRRRVEQSASAERALSVEDAARLRFKDNRARAEQQQLQSGLQSIRSLVSPQAVQDQRVLVQLLEQRLGDTRSLMSKGSSATDGLDYRELCARIERDLHQAKEILLSMEQQQQE